MSMLANELPTPVAAMGSDSHVFDRGFSFPADDPHLKSPPGAFKSSAVDDNLMGYTLPSVSYHTSGSSGFCDTASSTADFFRSATCSSRSVSSSRSNSVSPSDDNSSFSCLSNLEAASASNHPSAGSSTFGATIKCTNVIVVPEGDAMQSSNSTKTGSSQKKNGPIDILLSKISNISINSAPGALTKSQSATALNHKNEVTQVKSRADSSRQTNLQVDQISQKRSASPRLLHRAEFNNQVASLTATSTQALILEKRPQNLPQKDPKEEKKHYDQYLMLLEQQKKREEDQQKRLEKKLQKRCKFADDMSQLQFTWLHDVIPNWSDLKGSNKVREMWWMGVPPMVRSKLWPLAIGNGLHITHELFTSLSSKSSELITLFSHCDHPKTGSNGDLRVRKSSEDVFGLIKLDVSRTFMRYKVFQEDQFYSDSLQKLLAIYVCYRHDISYIQGMNNIAAVLLLNMDLEPAFIGFANLINRSILMNFFALRLDKINQYYKLFQYFFSENLPKLCNHFREIDLTPKFYLMQWILSLFSNSLPLDISSRIWDVYLMDGDVFLFRAALGLLKYFESHLMTFNDFTEAAQFFNKLPDDIDCDRLFDLIKSISVSRSKFKKFCDKFIENS